MSNDKIAMILADILVEKVDWICLICHEKMIEEATESHNQFLDIHYVVKHSMEELAEQIAKNQIKTVDMCKEQDNSKTCAYDCTTFSGMEYTEAQIDSSGSEMSCRHYGECIHGVPVYDKVELYTSTF